MSLNEVVVCLGLTGALLRYERTSARLVERIIDFSWLMPVVCPRSTRRQIAYLRIGVDQCIRK